MRILCNMGFTAIFGIIGIWIGEAVCTYLCILILMQVIYHVYGKDRFPFLLEYNGNNSLNISYRTDPEIVIKTRDAVESFLMEHKTPRSAINLSMLFFEDMSMLIRSANGEDSMINIDAFITCTPKNLHIVMWCDGADIDLSDAEKLPSGISNYIVASLFMGFNEHKYQQTAGYNRASFLIPYERLSRQEMKSDRSQI